MRAACRHRSPPRNLGAGAREQPGRRPESATFPIPPSPRRVHAPSVTDGTAIFGFFEHALAALGPATSMVGGHLALEVYGEGRRVVDLSVPGGRWSSHDDEPAASTVWGTADALTDLVLHPDRIPLHVRAGALRLSGDRELVARLASLLRKVRPAWSRPSAAASPRSPRSPGRTRAPARLGRRRRPC